MRFLAAVDVHDQGESVVDQAVPWVRRLKGTLDLVFASEWSTEGIPEAPDRLDKLYQQWNALADEEREKLAEIWSLVPEDIRGTSRIAAGRPVDVLPDLAATYDVLVLGTHSRTGLERVLLGSVVSRVLRYAPGATLIVGIGDPVVPSEIKVLAPLAHHEPGALPWLHKHMPAEHIEIVHVLPPERWLPPSVLAAGPDPAQRAEVIRGTIKARAAAFGFPAAALHLVPCVGQPGDTIATMAHDLDAHLVVMPTHGRTGLDRWFLGSVAERVVERAPCAVLVLPMAVAQPD